MPLPVPPSVHLVVDAPPFADDDAGQGALREYADRIDFSAAFGYLKTLAGCVRRSEVDARRLKMMLPRLSVDHGGERVNQEFVQRVRAALRASVNAHEVLDPMLTMLRTEFLLWQNPPPAVIAAMRAERRSANMLKRMLAANSAPSKPAKKARTVVSTVPTTPVAAIPVAFAVPVPHENDRGDDDDARGCDFVPTATTDMSLATSDDQVSGETDDVVVECANVATEEEAAEEQEVEDDEAETRASEEHECVTPSRQSLCTVCSVSRTFVRTRCGALACPQCNNTFSHAGLDDASRRKSANGVLLLYYKKTFPGFLKAPVMELRVDGKTDLDNLKTCSRAANCEWIQNLPAAYLHRLQTLNKNVTAVYYKAPKICRNGVNAYKHMCILHGGRLVDLWRLQKKHGGPGFHQLVSTLR